MAQKDKDYVTFTVPDKPRDCAQGSEYGEQNQRPKTPKPSAAPPAQRIAPQANQTTGGKEETKK